MRYIAAATVLLCRFTFCSAAESITVPPSEMLTTSSQDGIQHVGKAFEDTDNKASLSTKGFLKQIYTSRQGSSNVFLVDAANANEAIDASASVFIGGRSASTPAKANKQRALRGNYWLVAFLGAGHSDPVKWTVDGVTIVDNKIQLTYHEPEAFIGTADVALYYYWVPLGKLEPGTYQIELYDADEKAVTLMRRVVVEQPK